MWGNSIFRTKDSDHLCGAALWAQCFYPRMDERKGLVYLLVVTLTYCHAPYSYTHMTLVTIGNLAPSSCRDLLYCITDLCCNSLFVLNCILIYYNHAFILVLWLAMIILLQHNWYALLVILELCLDEPLFFRIVDWVREVPWTRISRFFNTDTTTIHELS